MIPSIELQKAIYSVLSSSKWEVHEVIPPKAPLPYIQIGNLSRLKADTKTNKRHEFIIMIHSWSKGSSSIQVKEMNNFIYDSIHTLQMSTYSVSWVELELEQTIKEDYPDGTIFHGVHEFKIILNEGA